MSAVGSRSSLSQLVKALSRLDQTSPLMVTAVSVSNDPYGGRSEISLDIAMYGHAEPDEVVASLGFGSGSPKWIEASQSKPRSDDVVLVCRGRDVGTAQYWGKKYGWSVSPSPTHWMPMPTPADGDE